MLDLMAWERGIQRFSGEPLSLYRKRVKYAFINARDAGEVPASSAFSSASASAGSTSTNARPNEPWDVITIELADASLAANQQLLQTC
jgi:hypothetical protein